jgi:hypothetical protein
MEIVHSSETSLNYWTTWHYIPEDITLNLTCSLSHVQRESSKVILGNICREGRCMVSSSTYCHDHMDVTIDRVWVGNRIYWALKIRNYK